MFQVDEATASPTLPTPVAAGTQGFFTNGNPATGIAATILDADFLNMVQQELINVVTAVGLTPSKTTYNQVLGAIKRLGQNTVVLADTGAVNAYAAANAVPLVAGASPTWVDGVVQAVKIAHTNTGASTYAPDGLTAIPIYGLGLQPLQGGELLLNSTAILMHLTVAGVNGGNPVCVLMECAGGTQQVPPASASQHAAQLGQVSGVVGQVRNLTFNLTAASATGTISADEIVVETTLGGLRYCLGGFGQTINLATTGAGGMDTGTAPVSGYVAIYAIYNPTTSARALLATNASAASAPNIYAGALPSGYTASALVSVRATTAAALFAVASQRDRVVSFPLIAVLNTTTAGTNVSLNVATAAPKNAISVSGQLTAATNTGSGDVQTIVASDTNASGAQSGGGYSTGAAIGYGNFKDLQIVVALQTIYYSLTAVNGSAWTWGVFINGYTF